VTRTRFARAATSAREPLVVCLLGLPATVPLWKSSLPRSFDGMFHLFRVLEIDHLTRQGVLFPRWAPDLLYGYGYPVFDFVPHLPYYLTDVLHLMGLTLVHSILLSFGLSLLASGVAMYLFVKDFFGSNAAVLAAVAYMYAPFHLYDILFRGHLPGAWAMVLYPLVLWSIARLVQRGGVSWLVASALLYAACMLTHNPANFIFTPFLLFYTLVLVFTRSATRTRSLIHVSALLMLGFGLAAFFWMPALWDRQFIQIQRMITPPDLDYHTHFITISELLAPPRVAEVGLMNPGVPNSLGLVLVALSVLSIAGLWRLRGRHERVLLIIALCGAAAVVFLVSPPSALIWESIPLMKYLVFPHRFLRLGSLLMAVLCGGAVRLFGSRGKTLSPSFVVTLVGTGAVILSAFPLLYPPYYRDQQLNPSFVDMMEFERSTGTLGTTSFGEYLPVWVEWTPSTSPLEQLYQSSAQVERLDQNSLPEGTRIASARYSPTSMTVVLSTPHTFEATFHLIYFPTWRAYVDGQEVPISPTPGQGLIQFTVPGGEHVIQIQTQDMPVHILAKLITGLSLLLLVLVCALSWVRPRTLGLSEPPSPPDRVHPVAPEASDRVRSIRAAALALMSISLLAFKVGYVDTHDTWFKREFDGLKVRAAQSSLDVNFGDQVSLLGYDLPSATLQPGDTLSVTLYWKARQNLNADYSAFAQLVDEQMNIYAQMDSLHPGRYPTHLWEPEEYNQDAHEIYIPPGTPPGEYSLGVGLYDPETMMRLPILESEGHQAGMYFLAQITVTKPDRPPTVEELGIQHPVTVQYDNGMTLLGHSAERGYLPAGDFYRLALFWRADAPLADDYSVTMRLLNNDGAVALSHTSAPSAGRYHTTDWEEGEIVRDNHALRIPTDFPEGHYRLELMVIDSNGRTVDVQGASDVSIVDGWLELLSLDSVR
jgi:hypothetical protein